MTNGTNSSRSELNVILKWIIKYIEVKKFIPNGINNKQKIGYIIGFIIRRAISISVLRSTLLLLKAKRCKLSSSSLLNYLRNSISLILVSTGIPIIRLLGKGYLNEVSLWISTSILSLSTFKGNIPNWLVTYIGTESMIDFVKNTPTLNNITKYLTNDDKVTNRIGQLLFSATVSMLFYQETSTKGIHEFNPDDISLRLLFGKNSLVKDFLLIYGINNLISSFKIIIEFSSKSKKPNNQKPKKIYYKGLNEYSNDSINNNPLMDKISEIYELTLEEKHSLKEKLLDSFLVNNITLSMKWTIWRQLLKIMIHNRRFNRKNFKLFDRKSNCIIQFLVLALSFGVIDNKNTMKININLMKYLMRLVLTKWADNAKKLTTRTTKIILFASSTLEFYNYSKIDT